MEPQTKTYEQLLAELEQAEHEGSALNDFRLVFRSSPEILLLLTPDFRMVESSDARLKAIHMSREETIGRDLFEVFPDNPDNEGAQGQSNLRASLMRVLATKQPDEMALQRYDLARPDGRFEERYWRPLNIPVLGPEGEVKFIIHRVEDATANVRLATSETNREREQEQAQQALKLANRELSEKVAELEAARRRLDAVLGSAVSGIVVLQALRDEQGRITNFRFVLINPAGEKLVNKSNDELQQTTMLEVWPGHIDNGLFDLYSRVADTGESAEKDVYYGADSYDLWLNVSAVRVDDGVAVTFTDITEHKRTEAEAIERAEELQRLNRDLGEQRRFAETLLERLPGGVAYLDKDFVFRVVNPTMASFYGKPTTEVIDRHVYDVLPGAAKDIEASYAQVRETLEPLSVEAVPVSYEIDGEEKLTYWDATVVPYLDKEGRFDGWLVLAFEVSERVRSAEEFDRQQNLMARIINNAPISISYLDKNLVYQWVNPSQAETYQIPVEQWLGRTVYDVLGPETEAQTRPYWEQALRGEPYYGHNFPFEYTTVDGKQAWTYWDFSYNPVRGADGEVEGILVHGQEVTARVETTQLKERLQAERINHLEESNSHKEQFLGILSHELRTPLNAIQGFGSILQDGLAGALTTEQNKYLDKILASSELMLGLVDDLLDMSRVQAGKFSLDRRRTEIPALVKDALASVASDAIHKGLTLINEVPGTLPVLSADPRRVGQILSNLVTNAIKYTPEGGTITVRARVTGDVLRVDVSDTGLGVSELQQGRIFQAFTQVDMTNTRKKGGVGLGLSIVKALVEAHGGAVGVESQGEGKGSTFFFTLPLMSN